MRKFWVVLLAMGLIMAFAMPAAAVDVKFSGQYYVQGIYDNNRSLRDDDSYKSTAFVAQRLRMQTTFQIAEGLALVTRFDALEKKWGDHTWTGDAGNKYDSINRPANGPAGGANSREQESIEFERAYLDFKTGIGRFMVGYQNFVAFGTSFADSHHTKPGVKWLFPIGDTLIGAAWEQNADKSSVPTVGGASGGNATDSDKSVYDLFVIQKFKGGDAGLLFQYLRDASNADAANVKTKVYVINPYVKATFGPVFVEAEMLYGGGKLAEYSAPSIAEDVDLKAWGAYIGAKATFGPAYVGGLFAWISGDDPGTTDEKEGGVAATFGMGQVFSPCLILWNDPTSTWMGGLTGYGTASVANYMDNAWFFGLYAGYKPIPKLDVKLAGYYAKADEKPAGYVEKDYGYEADLTATYKIYDNLEYMVGIGYLWTGDFFKGTSNANKVDDDYMITHKLTLNF